MKQRHTSMDGFIPRRPEDRRGLRDGSASISEYQQPTLQSKPHVSDSSSREKFVGQASRQLSHANHDDIGESLRQIQPSGQDATSTRRRLTGGKPKKKRKILKWVIILFILIVASVGAYVGIKAFLAGSKVFKGNIFDIIQNQPLKKDLYGRSNFVVFGTAEDDEGGNHGGANLTDSIMVISVDQEKKDAFMISLPRDMWVRYQETCTVGNQGKLNAVYFCASDNGEDEVAGAAALQAKVGEITGLDIQYYIHVNFTVVVEAVDAIGGVDVTIQSEDPRGILDRNFDWKCRNQCYYVNYKNGERVHLDGEHALALARARNASGGYGLPGGNFDREKNQQMILKALREKAVSAGTLTNVNSVTGLIDALGNNLRTNIQTKEIRTLMSLGTDIPTESIRSLSLVGEDEPLVTTGSYLSQSIVRPVAGVMDYSDIKAYVAKNASADPVVREGAPIVVLNGSGEIGVASRMSDLLESRGYTVSVIDDAPDGEYDPIQVYQIGSAYPQTASSLQHYFSLDSLIRDGAPVSVAEGTGFVVIVGPGYQFDS